MSPDSKDTTDLKDRPDTTDNPGEDTEMEAVADQLMEQVEIPFEAPRFVEEESGRELLVDTDSLNPETFEPGEIVDVIKPGNKKVHYRVLKIEEAADGGKATAYVKEAPPIYGKALLLLLLLALAWFGLDKLFDFLF